MNWNFVITRSQSCLVLDDVACSGVPASCQNWRRIMTDIFRFVLIRHTDSWSIGIPITARISFWQVVDRNRNEKRELFEIHHKRDTHDISFAWLTLVKTLKHKFLRKFQTEPYRVLPRWAAPTSPTNATEIPIILYIRELEIKSTCNFGSVCVCVCVYGLSTKNHQRECETTKIEKHNDLLAVEKERGLQ